MVVQENIRNVVWVLAVYGSMYHCIIGKEFGIPDDVDVNSHKMGNRSMDPVEKLSPERTEEFLSQLHDALNLNAKQTLNLTERLLS
jgi:hypothetical protein